MDTLHHVLTALRSEKKSGDKHLTVFREFLSHLDQVQRKAPTPARPKQPARKPKRRTRK
jgi:hypothetical protein